MLNLLKNLDLYNLAAALGLFGCLTLILDDLNPGAAGLLFFICVIVVVIFRHIFFRKAKRDEPQQDPRPSDPSQ